IARAGPGQCSHLRNQRARLQGDYRWTALIQQCNRPRVAQRTLRLCSPTGDELAPLVVCRPLQSFQLVRPAVVDSALSRPYSLTEDELVEFKSHTPMALPPLPHTTYKPVKAIFKPSQQRGRDVAVYVLPDDPELCMEFSFKRFNTAETIATYVCVACRALKDRAPRLYGVVPIDGYFLSDPTLPEHPHFCEPRNYARSMMRREIIAKFNEIRESITDGTPEEVEEDLLQAINKPEYAHFGEEERQEMVKQLVMGHIGGRDTLRSMIRTNKRAKRRRVQFEYPEDAPPPTPMLIFPNAKREHSDARPPHFPVHPCY
ncbi:hypothetical protein OSTOST_22362, partial [Ostertagia ostertagi]